jgi:hypothetical protein
MRRILTLLALATGFMAIFVAAAQQRPYIGFAYPAGGRQGGSAQVKLGGQGLDDVVGVLISGEGVSGRVIESQRLLGNQEMTLLSEQLKELKAKGKSAAPDMMNSSEMMASGDMMSASTGQGGPGQTGPRAPDRQLSAKVERRIKAYVNRPASAALAHIVDIEVSIGANAAPGQRELRVETARGISNPLFFHVGQLPEYSRPAMTTSPLQVLGKEHLALRKRPETEAELPVSLPCVMNGQVAAGEINRYRFKAVKGQKLVFSALARQLVPFIADAVPGWFQPVLRLTDASGKELAYNDDYQFRPDPVILFEPPADGEYLLDIYDSIYRGREDFVYRISAGELPFISAIFPLGGVADGPTSVKVEGWNLGHSRIPVIERDQPGLCRVIAMANGLVSNPRPFELDTLPEPTERENNDSASAAESLKLPVLINGRIDRKDDWDVFEFSGLSNQVVVAEVRARKLESPLDSVVKITDAKGGLVAFNDDNDDPFSGANTHPADSYIRVTLPSNGVYYAHLGDTARNGGVEYAYRLRLSAPRPDFALRAVPSSLSLRSRSSGTIAVHLERKDGLTNAVRITLSNPPEGFSASPAYIAGTQTVARLTIKSTLVSTPTPVDLEISGVATIEGGEVTRVAVPSEDRMQAFLWKHLVPAAALKAMVYDPARQLPPARPTPALSDEQLAAMASSTPKGKQGSFTKQQVSVRLRQLKRLYEEGLLTDSFYLSKVAECEAARQN